MRLLESWVGTPLAGAVGWTLLLIGALTTVPLAFEVLAKNGQS